MIGEFLKKARGERTIGQIASTSEFEKSYLSKLERGVYKPKPDKIFALAKAYSVDVNELIALMFDVKLEELYKILGVIKVNYNENKYKLSESQWAMLKHRIKRLFEMKGHEEEFYLYDKLCAIINNDSSKYDAHDVNRWIRCLPDRTFDNHLDTILSYLETDYDNIFLNMPVKITSPHEVECLGLTEDIIDATYPQIISGKKIFPKLEYYSLETFQLMCPKLAVQLFTDDFVLSKPTPEVIDIQVAASSGKEYKPTPTTFADEVAHAEKIENKSE